MNSFTSFAKGQSEIQKRLKLATTTSTENTELLDVLIPAFTASTGIEVNVIAVGTGKAIALGEYGDLDIIMVHGSMPEAGKTILYLKDTVLTEKT